jgi:hypothetical protein
LYSSANHDEGLSDTKFVFSSAAPVLLMPLLLALQRQWEAEGVMNVRVAAVIAVTHAWNAAAT